MDFTQLSIFDLFHPKKQKFVIDKPIALIELFAGVGAQALSLDVLGVPYKHHFVCEFDKFPCASYSAIHGVDVKPIDICAVHGKDLKIDDKKHWCYMMTYSFPCTDLSVAGKQEGMKKGSGTRSGLLWEVERILTELQVARMDKPDVLIMENVPQIHSKKNIDDFVEWQKFLEKIGYTNYWQDMNAAEYGVPQSRNRTFMVSVLGNYDYKFPEPIELKSRMKDYLEPVVDEKYYINSDRAKKLLDGLRESGKLPH